MGKVNLIERGTVLSEAPSEDGTWRVRLINEGRGSSGVYSAELLENFHDAFDNVVSFINHPTGSPSERNFTEIAGKVVGSTWVDRGDDGTVGIYANWLPDEDHRKKLEAYRESLGLSIYIAGEGEDRDGEFQVTEFDRDDPFRSVDVVLAAGRGGRLNESALHEMYAGRKADDEKPGAHAQETDERNPEMDELIKAVEALADQVKSLVAEKADVEAEKVQAEADEKAVSSAVEAYDAAVKAIDEADLFESQVATIRAEAREGKDVAPLIEAAKQVKKEAESAVAQKATAVEGHVNVEGSAKGFSFTKIAEAR